MKENVSSDTTLWKGAILPSSVVAIFLIITMSVVNGRSGLLGALLASITVIIFFSIHLLVARVSRDLDPMATMALAITKFTDRSTVDRPSFAICAILITMAWLFGEIRSFLKLRVNLPLPKREEDR
jgi:ATP synthase protein I